MAYGLKWFNEFKEVEGQLVRVEILQRDYSGASTEVKRAGEKPIVISLAGDATSDPFDPIRPQRATIEWISDDESGFDIENLFITDDQEFKVILKIDGTPKWYGFVIHSDCQEPYHSKPYPVTISATCGLAFLDRFEVVDENGRYYYESLRLRSIFQGAFRNIGHDLAIEDCTNLTCPMSVAVVSYQTIIKSANIDSDGTRGMTYMQFLGGILNATGSFLSQSNGAWVIQANRVLTESEFDRVLFDSNYENGVGSKINKTKSIISPSDKIGGIGTLRPTANVIEKLAQPKSKVRVNVKPGVQVNRLRNGSFVPGVGGDPDGWTLTNMRPSGSFEVIGNGSPEDAYKLYCKDFLGSQSTVFVRSDVIEFNIEEFGAKDTENHNIKIRVSGAIKGENTSFAQIKVRVNFGERDWVDFMLSDGSWDQRKPLTQGQTGANVFIPAKTGFHSYSELELNTFDFESKPITNWINRVEGWLAKIQLVIDKSGLNISGGLSPSLWLEDFAITVDTGTAYEGDHIYEIDASKLILNGEDYTYDIHIADKINITTLEQRRIINRVMTGYLMISIGLTNDWVRIVDGEPDPLDPTPRPLQHLSLVERIRLLCGKRSILEGTFIGKDIWPDSRIINTIEEGRKPMMVTDWEWNVKDNQYRLNLFELDFTPLPNEEINLVEEYEGGGRRRVTSGGGGNTGNSTLSARKPIKVDDLPPIQQVLKKPVSYTEDIEDYLISYQDIDTLAIRMIQKPPWAKVDIEELVVEITGVPDIVGEDQVLIEVFDGSGDEYIISIPVLILPITLITYTLSPGGAITPGLPKQLPHDPPYSGTIQVKGGHDRYQWTLKGGGGTVDMDSGLQEVSYTEEATYTPLSGTSLPEGIYSWAIVTWRNMGDEEEDVWVEVYRGQSAVFILGDNIGDDDPEYSVTATLDPVGANLTAAGVTVEYIPDFNLTLLPVGIIHDRLFVSIMPEEDPFTTDLYPDVTDVTGSITNEEIDTVTGVASPDAGWYATGLVATGEGDRFWSDGDYFLYNGVSYVGTMPAGELITPSGVDGIRVNKAGSAPYLHAVEFTDYTLFPSLTEKPAGSYSGFIRAFLAGDQVYEKYVKWIIRDEVPEEPVLSAGLLLVEPGSVYATIASLPASGGVYPLPTKWDVLCPDFDGTEFDKVSWVLEQEQGGWMVVNIGLYTGQPNEKLFGGGVGGAIDANTTLFWGKNSTQIGDIHTVPSRFRATFTAWMEGVKVGVKQSDFRFSNTPIGSPSGVAFLTITIDDIGDGDEVIGASSVESNIPETGRFYPIPTDDNKFWAAQVITIDNTQPFDRVVDIVNEDIVIDLPLDAPVTALSPTEQLQSLMWNRSGDLDEPGLKEFERIFYYLGSPVGSFSASFTLYDEEPGVKDPNDCCKDGGEAEPTRVNFPTPITEWVWNHGWGRVPILRIIIGGEEWQSKVVHSDGDNTTTIFFNSPRAGFIEAI